LETFLMNSDNNLIVFFSYMSLWFQFGFLILFLFNSNGSAVFVIFEEPHCLYLEVQVKMLV
jgi:hypothetical protein